jgi:hypothetical protein
MDNHRMWFSISIHTYMPLTLYPRRGSRGISDIPPRHPRFTNIRLATRNTADVTGRKPIAVLLQPISGVSAINPLVAFYDIHGGKSEVLFFYFIPDTTRDNSISSCFKIINIASNGTGISFLLFFMRIFLWKIRLRHSPVQNLEIIHVNKL